MPGGRRVVVATFALGATPNLIAAVASVDGWLWTGILLIASVLFTGAVVWWIGAEIQRRRRPRQDPS